MIEGITEPNVFDSVVRSTQERRAVRQLFDEGCPGILRRFGAVGLEISLFATTDRGEGVSAGVRDYPELGIDLLGEDSQLHAYSIGPSGIVHRVDGPPIQPALEAPECERIPIQTIDDLANRVEELYMLRSEPLEVSLVEMTAVFALLRRGRLDDADLL